MMRWTRDLEAPPHVVDVLAQSDVYVLFQPIVRLADGTPSAYEALGRCRWPRYRMITELVDAAVLAGRMGRVGRLLREAAAESAPDHVSLFFNVHPAELSARWLVRPDEPMLMRSGPTYIEITEAAAIEHFEVASRVLGELRARADLKIVVDDLGAGHSDLSRVEQLRPAVVKLDRAIVQGLESHRRFVDDALEAAQRIGARVVAEGIETAEQAAAFRGLGVELGQGYFYARPAPAAAFWRGRGDQPR